MKKAAVIRGDGTGLELVDSMMRVIGAMSPDIEFVPCVAGGEWWKENGGDSLIPDEAWDLLHETDAYFKGPTTTPGAVGMADGADAIIRVTEQTIAEGITTYDLGGSASRSDMTDAITGHLE
ncbi:MAG TPA: hypothetical protein ENF23_06155 [Methanosarcinales archaeon]|nr:MAG: hypothetical protein DRO03_05310 [Methanosarcinales archaeon]HDN65854.1 hypothetical protein [Methanosarcinales archaeon]